MDTAGLFTFEYDTDPYYTVLQYLDHNNHYAKVVAKLSGIDLPAYAVISRVTGVVEAFSNVPALTNEWFDQLTKDAVSPKSLVDSLPETQPDG